MSPEIADQAIIVTGAGGDIGRAISSSLFRRGARVVLTDIDREKLNQTAATLEGGPGRVLSIHGDLRVAAEMQKIVEAAYSRFPRIDGLVNNAGGVGYSNTKRLVFTLTEDIWDEVFNINLRMHFFLSQAIAKRMVAGNVRGRIVNIGSNGGKTAQQGSRARY